MAWSFILTDLHGTVLGELLNANERKLVLPLNRIPTFSFTIPLWHDRATDLVNGDCLIKAYRRDTTGNRLVFVGPVTSIEEKGESQAQSIGVVASGPFWRLTKRFIGLTKAGVEFPAQDPGYYAVPQTVTVPNVQDLGSIAQIVLDMVNFQSEASFSSINYGYTGISNGSLVNSVNGFTGKMWLKNAAELISELSAGLGSFDYEVAPHEPEDVGLIWPKIGDFKVYQQLGSTRPDAIFEYGTPRANVTEYSRTRDWANMMNAGYISLSGWPDQLPNITPAPDLIFSRDETSMTNRGFFMDLANDAGILADDLRTKLIQEHIRWRKDPRQEITFVPATDATPRPFLDYNVGDYVRGRALVRGTLRFDLDFRVWGMTFNIDSTGREKLELQLIEEAS